MHTRSLALQQILASVAPFDIRRILAAWPGSELVLGGGMDDVVRGILTGWRGCRAGVFVLLAGAAWLCLPAVAIAQTAILDNVTALSAGGTGKASSKARAETASAGSDSLPSASIATTR